MPQHSSFRELHAVQELWRAHDSVSAHAGCAVWCAGPAAAAGHVLEAGAVPASAIQGEKQQPLLMCVECCMCTHSLSVQYFAWSPCKGAAGSFVSVVRPATPSILSSCASQQVKLISVMLHLSVTVPARVAIARPSSENLVTPLEKVLLDAFLCCCCWVEVFTESAPVSTMLHLLVTVPAPLLQITLVNRLLRLVTVISTAAGSSSEDTRRFHVAVTEQLPQPPGHWAHILRVILGMPLMYFNHANFVLPFAYVLGAQGVTLAAALVQLQKLPCLMTDKPLSMQHSQGLCQGAKLAMHYFGLLSCRPPALAAEAAAAECQGLEGLVLLCLYANLLLLVLVPCLFVYFAELRLKLGFLREQQLTLQHAPPCLESRVGRAVGVYGVLVGSWLACEAAVLFLSPLRCDSLGVLVRA